MENRDKIYNVAVIGAGVAGIYASYCCGVSGLSCVLFDVLSRSGGQCTAFYPDKKVYGVPGISGVFACDFISLLQDQASSFGTTDNVFNQKIVRVLKEEDVFEIQSASGSKYYADHIILATGIGDMLPNVPSSVEGIDSPENEEFVQYYCMKLDLYRDKEVIIAGGGDSAADFAINISRIAKQVTIIHRRDMMTCDHQKMELIKNIRNINLRLSTNIKAIEDGHKVITDSEVYHPDYIVFCYGFRSSPDTILGLTELGVRKENNLISVDFRTMQTKADKIFAIGDAIIYENKRKNIVSCFFEADRAVRMIRSQMATGLV